MAYPTDIYADTPSSGTSLLSSPDHSNRHNTAGTEITAIELKFGLGAGSPTLNRIPIGSGNGTSAWGTQVNNLGLGTPTIGTPSLTGGTVTGANVGTNFIRGGTIGTALIGTSTIQGGTANNQVIGTPSLTGGTLSAYQSKTHTIGSAAITGTIGSVHNLDLSSASRFLVNMPNTAGSLAFTVSNVSVNQPFMVELLQGTAGLGTVTWFSTVKWAGSAIPTQTLTASRKDSFGFMTTGAATFDGYIVGQNI